VLLGCIGINVPAAAFPAVLKAVTEEKCTAVRIGRCRLPRRCGRLIQVLADITRLDRVRVRRTRSYAGILIGSLILPAAVMTTAARARKVILYTARI